MMMGPKLKSQAFRVDYKFKANNIQRVMAQNAAAQVNDEARFQNFIQHENYEINSFRSNNQTENKQRSLIGSRSQFDGS
jgi:hypothetical protein